MKTEIEKFQNQRSNLIEKINSVNDAINDSNVLTNVFENSVKPKVEIIDHKKIKKSKTFDINSEVANIFAKN
jgi:hypothetical protein